MSRPNRARRKTTVWLGPDDLANIGAIKKAGKASTSSAAIRYALHVAAKPPRSTVAIGHRILEWVGSLVFLSPKDTRRLRQFSRELYELTRDNGDV